MKILVTGGLGFIGSHTVIELINNGYEVIIVDNLSNSEREILNHLESITKKSITFYEMDVTQPEIEIIFKNHEIDGIIHFAGFKAVGESVAKPLDYYYNNLMSTINLSRLALQYHVTRFIFSSSATVYGDKPSPMSEDMPRGETTNPYGETKSISERILEDTAKANDNFNVTLLRYFNPIGAHVSGLIGEKPKGTPNNLMPYITQTAKGIREKLYIFGNDYETPDGTGVRDYIHVVDLAKGHVSALEFEHKGVEIVNLGTGKGTSVLELVNAFERENNIKIPYEITKRRPGDVAISYASVEKAKKILKFESKLTIEDMVRDAWNFEKKRND
ncbi:MAG: UDP-glucose 4-epimerase GalE [Acholeplasmataceae bacterium]|jgi:UDP-glucose 4-epimerase